MHSNQRPAIWAVTFCGSLRRLWMDVFQSAVLPTVSASFPVVLSGVCESKTIECFSLCEGRNVEHLYCWNSGSFICAIVTKSKVKLIKTGISPYLWLVIGRPFRFDDTHTMSYRQSCSNVISVKPRRLSFFHTFVFDVSSVYLQCRK